MAGKMKLERVKPMQLRLGKRFFLSSSDLFGDIFFEFQDGYFPEENWNDFILIISTWWFDSLDKLFKGERAELLFMDGSYNVLIDIDTQQICHLDFVEGRSQSNKILHHLTIPFCDLVDAFIGAYEDLFQSIQNPQCYQFLASATEVETRRPEELMMEIQLNPSIFEQYEHLRRLYVSLCEKRRAFF